jgi:hypothetical protein
MSSRDGTVRPGGDASGTPVSAAVTVNQSMNLPFTPEQFFQVFAAYNLAVWPAQVLLHVLAIGMVALALWAPERAGRLVSVGLAILWCWLALAYHLAFFWSINPAAPLFAALSLVAAGVFLWLGAVRTELRFGAGPSAGRIVGLALIVFALVGNPALGAHLGHRFPAAPTFGLPCPTTLFTFGILLMAMLPVPKGVVIVPLLWAVIGSGAAFALGVTQDLALIVTVILGVCLLLRRQPPGVSGGPPMPLLGRH